MVRTLAIFVFLALAGENYAELPFEGRWETPFRPIGELLYRASPIKAPGVAVMLLILLAMVRNKAYARVGRVPALDRALWINFYAMVGMFIWGMLRGGAFMPALLQTQVMLFLPFSAFLFTAGLTTEAAFITVGKAIVWAALYRGVVALIFGLYVAPGLNVVPVTLTTHADTILFTSAVVILVSWALEQRTFAAMLRAGLGCGFLIVVIHLNNRRLAYVCIAGSIAILYFLLEKGPLKKSVNRLLLMMLPLVIVYLSAGAKSNSPVFKPARAFASMMGGESQDSSSQTRDIENYNLIMTLKEHPLLGHGWGHEYNEVSVAYSIVDAFALYRYIPHNSVLGLWAFAGYFASTAWWLSLVLCSYLGSRAYRFATTPLARTICAVAVCELAIYGLQGYGDMGLGSWVGNITMGVAFAASSRMAVLTGAFTTEPG